MRISDLLVRIGAFLMILSTLWNGVMSVIWFVTLALFLVGFLWLIPMALLLVELGVAIALMVVGHNKAVAAAPLIGMFVSVCNFNFIGFVIEGVALILMISSYFARSSEDQQELAYAA